MSDIKTLFSDTITKQFKAKQLWYKWKQNLKA